MTDKLLLAIDAMNIVRRIYEAIPEPDSDSKASKALKSSISSLRRALTEHRPSHACVVFDHGGNTWRHDLYSGYKANRDPMSDHLRDALILLKQELLESGIHWICVEGVEADDAIGALISNWCKFTTSKVVVLSTDKDFFKLICDQVCIYDHFKSEWRDSQWVEEKFGVQPYQFEDFLALMGDAVDGVPGISKIGKKTAAKLLRIHGNLDRIIANADKIEGEVGVNLRKEIDQARLSKQLVSFKLDIPLGLTWKMLAQNVN
jgi:protein Xni